MKLFSTPRRRRIGWASLVVAIVLLVWLLWPNRNLARVRALQGELFGDAGKALSPEERQAKFNALREATRKLSPAQREDLGRDGMRRQEDRMASYVKMSPLDKRRYLDEQINREEEMRRRMQQQGAKANGNRPPGAPGGPGMASGPGGPGGRGNRPPPTAQEKENRRKQMLDRTTPQFRENMDQFRRDMDARRQQRGLPPSPPGFGRGRRG